MEKKQTHNSVKAHRASLYYSLTGPNGAGSPYRTHCIRNWRMAYSMSFAYRFKRKRTREYKTNIDRQGIEI